MPLKWNLNRWLSRGLSPRNIYKTSFSIHICSIPLIPKRQYKAAVPRLCLLGLTCSRQHSFLPFSFTKYWCISCHNLFIIKYTLSKCTGTQVRYSAKFPKSDKIQIFFSHVPLFKSFYWRTIALQNFVVFCQTSTWIRNRYTYIPSILNLPSISCPIPPLKVDTESLFEFPEPYSKFLLAIYFIYGNVSFHVTLFI